MLLLLRPRSLRGSLFTVARNETRDWTQLETFETEYGERLADEKRRGGKVSQSPRFENAPFFRFLYLLATDAKFAYTDEIKARDEETRRLFALRSKIIALREKLGVPDDSEPLLPLERPYIVVAAPKKDKERVRVSSDVLPDGHLYPITAAEIRETLLTLPPEHAATVHWVHLTNLKNYGADGDWSEGEIRLHCLLEGIKDADGNMTSGRRLLLKQGRGGMDVVRFGGKFQREGNKLYAIWDVAAYKIFVLKRVLIHEVAHGIAELPGYAAQVRSVGSVEKFCEGYAENYYRPPGKSVRLGF